MRKKIVAGNWKMNTDLEAAKALASGIGKLLQDGKGEGRSPVPEVVLFPPYVFLPPVVRTCADHQGLFVGAQNCHQEEKGAFTGEVSAGMLASLGVTHVLVGHSERRAFFGEDDQLLAKKVERALAHQLTPVFCCGEMLQEREAGTHFDVITSQLENGLFWLDEQQVQKTVIAYEPVWAIGTGVTASPDQAQEVHAFIRKLLADKYGAGVSDSLPILYGGSCNAQNAGELFSRPDVDGGLIGGASLKVEDFYKIIQSF
jgi:triosephosphate isomerase (TIM)